MFPNFSLPTKQQWTNAAGAIVFAFLSAFLAVIMAAGGLQNSWEATLALFLSAGTAGINAVLYLVYVTFFKK